jgi:hypothetical protein
MQPDMKNIGRKEQSMTDFKAKRITRNYTQHFQAAPDKVFPLLCPTREYEWIEPWKCELLHSASGYAEQDCVFRTRMPGESSDDVWVISRHEPNSRIEFVRVNGQRVMSYAIILKTNDDGTTTAHNTQVLTALNADGNQLLNTSSDASFVFEMKMGEAMLNHYLTTGKMMPLAEAVAAAQKSGQH